MAWSDKAREAAAEARRRKSRGQLRERAATASVKKSIKYAHSDFGGRVTPSVRSRVPRGQIMPTIVEGPNGMHVFRGATMSTVMKRSSRFEDLKAMRMRKSGKKK